MSTIIPPKTAPAAQISLLPQVVIVKGFRGAQHRLKCVGIENFHFVIVGKDGKAQIRLKTKYVYRDDGKLYEVLKDSFDSGEEWGRGRMGSHLKY